MKIDKEIFSLGMLASSGFIHLVFFPYVALLIFQQVFNQGNIGQFNFYSNGIPLFFITIFLVIGIFIEKQTKRDSATFFTIHKPKLNPLLVSQISYVGFALLYLIISPFTNIAINRAFPLIPQNAIQDIVTSEGFGNFGRWIFTFAPVALQETLLIFSISALIMLIIKYIFKNSLFKDPTTAKFLTIILTGIFWAINGFLFHLANYGAEQFLLVTGIIPFWLFGGVLTAWIGSVFPAIAQHVVNNAFLGAILIYGSATGLTIGYIVVMAIVIFITYYILQKNKKVFLV